MKIIQVRDNEYIYTARSGWDTPTFCDSLKLALAIHFGRENMFTCTPHISTAQVNVVTSKYGITYLFRFAVLILESRP